MLLLIAAACIVQGRAVDRDTLSLSECGQGDPAVCAGERVIVGYVPVVAVEGDIVRVRDARKTFAIRGLPVTEIAAGRGEISVVGTWQTDGSVVADDHLRHPHRALKKAASSLGIVVWMLWLARRRRG